MKLQHSTYPAVRARTAADDQVAYSVRRNNDSVDLHAVGPGTPHPRPQFATAVRGEHRQRVMAATGGSSKFTALQRSSHPSATMTGSAVDAGAGAVRRGSNSYSEYRGDHPAAATSHSSFQKIRRRVGGRGCRSRGTIHSYGGETITPSGRSAQKERAPRQCLDSGRIGCRGQRLGTAVQDTDRTPRSSVGDRPGCGAPRRLWTGRCQVLGRDRVRHGELAAGPGTTRAAASGREKGVDHAPAVHSPALRDASGEPASQNVADIARTGAADADRHRRLAPASENPPSACQLRGASATQTTHPNFRRGVCPDHPFGSPYGAIQCRALSAKFCWRRGDNSLTPDFRAHRDAVTSSDRADLADRNHQPARHASRGPAWHPPSRRKGGGSLPRWRAEQLIE